MKKNKFYKIFEVTNFLNSKYILGSFSDLYSDLFAVSDDSKNVTLWRINIENPIFVYYFYY